MSASTAGPARWAYWFQDRYRSATGTIGWLAVTNLYRWIRQSLREDKPYNQYVTELLTASAPNSNWAFDAAPSNFLVRWHVLGNSVTSDMFEDTMDEIVVSVGKNFLGINYLCISCHGGEGHLEKMDLDLTEKTRGDFWKLSAFFGRMRMHKVVYQDRYVITEDGTGYDTEAPTTVKVLREGGEVVPTFLLTGEKADLSKPLRPQFARMVTEHPQFARATVNQFWKEFFNLGIVEPVDSFDMRRQDPANPPPAPWTIQPTNPALLNDLAQDFVEHNYSLKHLMKIMAKSSAYQLSSKFEEEWKVSYTPYFARRYVRRLWAEELHDSVSEATQVFGNYKRGNPGALRPVPTSEMVNYFPEFEAGPNGLRGSDSREIRHLLHIFGQANRRQFERSPVSSPLQTMLLMDSDFVSERVKAKNGSLVEKLVNSEKSNQEIMDELFLSTLCRYPTPEEKKLSLKVLNENRVQGAEDLQWVLLNKLDFVFNY